MMFVCSVFLDLTYWYYDVFEYSGLVLFQIVRIFLLFGPFPLMNMSSKFSFLGVINKEPHRPSINNKSCIDKYLLINMFLFFFLSVYFLGLVRNSWVNVMNNVVKCTTRVTHYSNGLIMNLYNFPIN